MRRLFLLILFLTVNLLAQSVAVTEVNKITSPDEGRFYFPEFSPDGSKLIFTSENYKGLILYNLESGNKRILTDASGAGFEPKFSETGKYLFFRKIEYKNRLKYSSLVKYEIETSREDIVLEPVRRLPNFAFSGNEKIKLLTPSGINLSRVNSEEISLNIEEKEIFVSVENRQIVIYSQGERKKLEPLGQGIYVWASLSPSKDKIVFTFGSKGTFISDLEGNILTELGYGNAPVWSPDGNWILCMRDYDDGYRVTNSEIYLYSSDGKYSRSLTDTEDLIEMYPKWGPSGDLITFHSEDGSIYLAKLKIDK